MSVHEEISKHSNDQHERVQTFLEYDLKREHWIDQAIIQYKGGEPFDDALRNINDMTDRINEIARKGIVPQRKNVTAQMIEDYCQKK